MSWQGLVKAIYVTPERGSPMRSVSQAHAVPGRGLEGDRYFAGEGSLSRWGGPKRELTLIAEEALEEMRGLGLELGAAETRRNVLVTGVPLNDLVKTEFLIGDVRVAGVRLCQPCKYLSRKTGKDVLPTMIGRGGLRARILSEGQISVGDVVQPG